MTNKIDKTLKEECIHDTIGWQTIGGFAGHPQVHPTGNQVCIDCGLTLKEIIQKALNSQKKEMIKEIEGMKQDIHLGLDGYTASLIIGHNEAIDDILKVLKEK